MIRARFESQSALRLPLFSPLLPAFPLLYLLWKCVLRLPACAPSSVFKPCPSGTVSALIFG